MTDKEIIIMLKEAAIRLECILNCYPSAPYIEDAMNGELKSIKDIGQKRS